MPQHLDGIEAVGVAINRAPSSLVANVSTSFLVANMAAVSVLLWAFLKCGHVLEKMPFASRLSRLLRRTQGGKAPQRHREARSDIATGAGSFTLMPGVTDATDAVDTDSQVSELNRLALMSQPIGHVFEI